jgi:hypothetical protein
MPHRGNVENAIRAERLAVLAERNARWWGVLREWTFLRTRHGHTMPRVYGRAASAAQAHEIDNARFWRDIAADWRARAEHRPTSDAAGALSNHHELGIAS